MKNERGRSRKYNNERAIAICNQARDAEISAFELFCANALINGNNWVAKILFGVPTVFMLYMVVSLL